ncbi:MAG: TerC/Alx family metal homeostasis membrane protein [Bacillota bacterium]|nr:TerC/Alx family metal homeostasis membrane protein [Bacillota bacterium]
MKDKEFFWKPFSRVLIFMSAARLFNLGILIFMGKQPALEFLGAYLIEFSLSMDNLFVFITIFTAFGISEHAEHRVLTYGIAGAIVLRLLFIALGVKVIEHFEFILYIFGVILLINGLKMCVGKEKEKNPQDSPIVKILGKVMKITPDFVGEKFFVKENKILYATPLFAVLLVIEFTDILFAIDSIPAVFSVTTNVFIAYTSNIFAILGLRQLYFVLLHLQERFIYVKYGVGIILAFTGVKLGILAFDIHISIPVSIGVIITVMTVSIIASIIVSGRRAKRELDKIPEVDTSLEEGNK